METDGTEGMDKRTTSVMNTMSSLIVVASVSCIVSFSRRACFPCRYALRSAKKTLKKGGNLCVARSLDKMKIAHSELVCTYSVSHARAYSSGSRPCVVSAASLSAASVA